MTPITPEDKSDLMQTLSSNKSTEPNSIPTSILKEINNSFENGIFPNLLKSAQVIPVFKNGSRLSCNNYRPISLLSNIGKIIDKLIHKRLNHFLEQHQVFYALQFSFFLNTSTNNALMSIRPWGRPLTLFIMTPWLQNLTTMELEDCLMIGSAHT